jgi:hypothetical protein
VRLSDLQLNIDNVLGSLGQERLDRRSALPVLLHEFGKKHGANFVIEKSPVHTYFLHEMVEVYSQSRFIALVRDGRDALLSLKRTPWNRWSDTRWAADWVYRNEIVRSAAERFPDRVKVVRFEDVVSGQHPFGELARWLFPANSVPQLGGRASSAIPKWELAWKSKAAGEVDRTRSASWRQAGEEKAIALFQDMAGDELRRWGYPSSPTSRRGRAINLAYRTTFPLVMFWRKLRGSLALGGHLKGERHALALMNREQPKLEEKNGRSN